MPVDQAASRFLRQPRRSNAPRPVAKSGRAAGSGVVRGTDAISTFPLSGSNTELGVADIPATDVMKLTWVVEAKELLWLNDSALFAVLKLKNSPEDVAVNALPVTVTEAQFEKQIRL